MKANILLGLLLLFFMCYTKSVYCQRNGLTIKITTENNVISLTKALISMKSNKNYYYLSGDRPFVSFNGIYVTSTLEPVQYKVVKAKFIKWKSIRSIEFVDFKYDKVLGGIITAKIIKNNESAAEVFLYSQYHWPDITLLETGRLKISGKEIIGREENDIEVYLSHKWKRIDFIYK